MEKFKLFTSESVSEGHPDKVCDKVSDSILDACLKDDPESRVACEVYATTGMVLVGGEITTNTYVDVQEVARNVVKEIGYTNPDYGIDYKSMAVLNVIHSQSPDISQGVTKGQGLYNEQGAGDQGMMFGFAINETPGLMPLPVYLSHKLLQKASELRKTGKIDFLRPDAKSQVTVKYDSVGAPVGIHTVVLSHQHHENIKHETIKQAMIEEVIKPILKDANFLSQDIIYHINPTGKFVVGGPHGDTGLTGRKIIVDTYGGMGRHGGGAFSGKDPSKVDRSACYMARYIAKNIVGAGLCHKAEVQLSYAIGVAKPISINVDTFGALNNLEERKLEEVVMSVFDLTPEGIINTLDLKKPIYSNTTNYGHFGRDGFSWEKLDKVDLIRNKM